MSEFSISSFLDLENSEHDQKPHVVVNKGVITRETGGF